MLYAEQSRSTADSLAHAGAIGNITNSDETHTSPAAASKTDTADADADHTSESTRNEQAFSVHADEYAAIRSALDRAASVTPLTACSPAMQKQGFELSFLFHS